MAKLSEIMDYPNLSIPFHLGCFKKAFGHDQISRVSMQEDGIKVTFKRPSTVPQFIQDLHHDLEEQRCVMQIGVNKNTIMFY